MVGISCNDYTVGWVTGKGTRPVRKMCWYSGGGNLIGALLVLQSI